MLEKLFKLKENNTTVKNYVRFWSWQITKEVFAHERESTSIHLRRK